MPTDPYQSQSYRDYALAYQPQAQYAGGGTRTIGGSVYNPTGGYTYTQNMRGDDFVKQNVRQDFTPWRGGVNPNSVLNIASGGISQVPRAISGYRQYKKEQANDRQRAEAWAAAQKERAAAAPTEYLGSIDPTSRTYQQARQRMSSTNPGDYMSVNELQQGMHQEQQANQRQQYEQAINAYFDDPARAGWQQQIIQDRLNNDLAQVSDQYGQDLQRSVQGAAARGMRGGSADVEGRGDVARVRDTRAIGAAADADAQRSAFQNRDLQERNNLMGLVNSRGITEGQQLSQALQGIHANTAAEGANYATRQRQQEIDRFGQQSQSQAWGQGLSSIAGSIRRQNPQTTQGGW